MTRSRYVKAMLRAIDKAADRPDPSPYVRPLTRSAGLRCIRAFERVNGIAFDPFDERHVSKVSGMARFGEVIRLAQRSTP